MKTSPTTSIQAAERFAQAESGTIRAVITEKNNKSNVVEGLICIYLIIPYFIELALSRSSLYKQNIIKSNCSRSVCITE